MLYTHPVNAWLDVLGEVQKWGGAGGGGRAAPREHAPFHGDSRPEAQAAGRHARREEPKESRGAADRGTSYGAVRRGRTDGLGFRDTRRAAAPRFGEERRP